MGTWKSLIRFYENFLPVGLDPVRESVGRATSAMLTAGGMKETAEVIPLKQVKKLIQR
jgi:hypothetical protein